ncbi:hypothetical protein PoB_003020500 [Plakobranchus ocellatus]|uniref:Uncharacterized protein n=1 Tax=Plakobranchus ocellatus TaxID=259542 RepID=A0AAV4A6A7_9GAST|nr:hypothetical protein PoB_003020500 [Plakobranchus ocellatus]
MFPWDDRGDGHPSDTTLLNTLAPVLVAHGLLTHVHNKVISGSRPSVRSGRRWRGSNPRQKGTCKSQGGLTSRCATDAVSTF